MRRLRAWLAAAVILRLAFHVVFVPAFEGPDEPHHLARVQAFASGPFGDAFRGSAVQPPLVQAVRGNPCGLGLHRDFGCPLFGRAVARFDVLAPGADSSPAAARPNPEDHQPPLYYALAGLALRALRATMGTTGTPSPVTALLFLRLLSVALVAAALLWPLRRLARGRPPGLAVGVLLLLLTPGAAEALARASNDGALFLWAALCLDALERRARAPVLLALLAAGPLLKLTAFPIVAFALVGLAAQRRVRLAVFAALASLSVFPVQAARGWLWGGTYEFNRAARAPLGSLSDTVLGLARSAYTFVKTTFWLGEWSFFRAPRPLVAAFFLLLAGALVAARRRVPPLRLPAHAAAASAAALGFLAFAVGNRLFYGDWGGLGGWYVWGWLPWLALAASDLATLSRRGAAILLTALAAFVLVANALWLAVAWPLYGIHPGV